VTSGTPPDEDAPAASPELAPPPSGRTRDQIRRDGLSRTRSDLSLLARGGTQVLVGNVFSGLMRLVFIVVVARALGAKGAGELLEALALLAILSNAAELGSDTGLARMVPRYRALGRTQDLRRLVAAAVVPVFVIGAILGGLMFALAPHLAHAFIHQANRHDGVVYIRFFALIVPLSAVTTTALAATRGFGTMAPYVLIQDGIVPLSRVLLAIVALVIGVGVAVFALGWVVPVAVWSVAAVAILYWLIRRAERMDRYEPSPRRPLRSLAGEFWRFSSPRALAGFFQVVIFSLDTLLIGALRSTSEAAVYAAAGRVAVMSAFALSAIGFALGPQIAHLLTRGENRRAEAVFPLASLRQDKYWPPVRRIDGAFGDRNLVCSCPPVEAYESV